MAKRSKKKASSRAKKTFAQLKALDPKSVVRESEVSVSQAFKAFKKLNPQSVVRESEFRQIRRRKKK